MNNWTDQITRKVKAEQFGCVYGLHEGTLFYIPLLDDGSECESTGWSEVAEFDKETTAFLYKHYWNVYFTDNAQMAQMLNLL